VLEDELLTLLLGHGIGLIKISRCRQSRLLLPSNLSCNVQE
jgi:hypothetical protein